MMRVGRRGSPSELSIFIVFFAALARLLKIGYLSMEHGNIQQASKQTRCSQRYPNLNF